MSVKKLGRELKESIHAKAKEIELSGVKQAGDKAAERIKGIFKKQNSEDNHVEAEEGLLLPSQEGAGIPIRSAEKIIYFLMAADGTVYHGEEEKFDAVGVELDPDFLDIKEQIIKECQESLDKAIDPEDYYEALQEGVEEALSTQQNEGDILISPRQLVWDLLSVAYSDERYSDAERRLVKYVVRKCDIEKAVFLEMESSMQTLIDMERELSWIKTTNRPYLAIEAVVNELSDRKAVILESIVNLIKL